MDEFDQLHSSCLLKSRIASMTISLPFADKTDPSNPFTIRFISYTGTGTVAPAHCEAPTGDQSCRSQPLL